MDRPNNRLLASLPDEDFNRVAPHLRCVPLEAKSVLHRQGERIRDVYFPNGGVVSIVTALSTGEAIEGATVGDEGMVGLPAFFADYPISPFESVVQVPDHDALTLSMEEFRRELNHVSTLHKLMEAYAQVIIAQIMQSNACNAVHVVQQRCARWLLMTHDRVRRDEFQLSQEFLAQMLGVHRPTVSEVAGLLQDKGYIRYRYGRIQVLSREALERCSCECYGVMRAHFDRLQGSIAPSPPK